MRTLAISLALLVAGSARADLSSHDIEQLHVPEDGQGLLGVEGGTSLSPGTLRVQALLDYEKNAVELLDAKGNPVQGIVSDRLTTELAAALAIHERLTLRLAVPLIPVQSGDAEPGLDLAKPKSFSFSTIRVGAKVPLLFEKGQFIDLAVLGTLTLPSGSSGAYSVDPSVGFEPRLAASRTLGPVVATASAGVLIHKEVPVSGQELGPTVSYGGGLAYPIADVVSLEAEIYGQEAITSGHLTPGSLPTNTGNGLEGLLGARKSLSWLSLFGGAGLGLSRAAGTPEYRLLLGVADNLPLWSTEPPSIAKPLPVLAACDPARLRAPAQRPRPDQCPDLDNDGDGLPNRLDRCPEEPGPASNQGCPVLVPPAPARDPVVDTDGDGIPDAVDRCPKEPEDKDAFEDMDGCPEPDNDQDGVPDQLDRCPNVAGPAENFGCPPIDTDKDGVPDLVDNCPSEPGPKSNQGCPIKSTQLVVITRTKLEIKDKVYFETDKSKILPRSFKLLDNVANVLREHPDLARLVIEGHTDNQGNRNHNLTLSQDRANSVKAYLLKKGIDAGRLEAIGYGPDRPAGNNATAKGREQNRRVEFVVLNEGQVPEPAPEPAAHP